MNGPARVIVIDDSSANAAFLAAIWSESENEQHKAFFAGAQKFWICATDAIPREEYAGFLAEYGEGYDNAQIATSLEDVADLVEVWARPAVDEGVLIYLDVQLDQEVCQSVGECINSRLADILTKWVSESRGVFIHVHSGAHLDAMAVAERIDPNMDRLAHCPEARVTGSGVITGQDQSAIERVVDHTIKRWSECFSQGFERRMADAIATALREGVSHPDSWAIVPEDLFLKSTVKECGDLDDFKAIFHVDVGKEESRFGCRPISRSALESILAQAGVVLKTKGQSFVLPVQPGGLFLIRLSMLLRALVYREKIALEVTGPASRRLATMWIRLRDSEIFEAAWWQRDGRGDAAHALRRLIGVDPRGEAPDRRRMFTEEVREVLLKGAFFREAAVLRPIVTPIFVHERNLLGLEWGPYHAGNI